MKRAKNYAIYLTILILGLLVATWCHINIDSETAFYVCIITALLILLRVQIRYLKSL